VALTNQDFEMWAGDDMVLVFTIQDEENIEDATSIKWAMARSVRGPKLVNKTGTATGNQTFITLEKEDTEDIRPGRYYHELEITDYQGRVSTAAMGSVRVWPTLIPQPVEEE